MVLYYGIGIDFEKIKKIYLKKIYLKKLDFKAKNFV